MKHHQPVGRHTITFERPDLLHVEIRGDVSEQDIAGMRSAVHGRARGLPEVLLLVNLAELGEIPRESRRAIAYTQPAISLRGIAFYQTSFQAKLVIKLVLGAMELLYKRPDNAVEFFGTEAQARAWLEARRRAVRREDAVSPPP